MQREFEEGWEEQDLANKRLIEAKESPRAAEKKTVEWQVELNIKTTMKEKVDFKLAMPKTTKEGLNKDLKANNITSKSVITHTHTYTYTIELRSL